MVASVSQPPTAKTLTREELLKKAIEEAGLAEEDLATLPLNNRYVNGGVDWVVNQPVPGGQSQFFQVFAIFEHPVLDEDGDYDGSHLAGDVRVYCLPRRADAGFARYKLNRAHPMSLLCAGLSLEGFIAEVAEEFSSYAGLTGADEGTPRDCRLCQATCEDESAKFCGACGAALPPVPQES